MNKTWKALGALGIFCVLAVVSVLILDFGGGLFHRTMTLAGNTPMLLNQGQLVSRSDPNAVMRVVVGLKFRDQDQLDQLIKHQSDPSSPDYRHWLTLSEFVARFSPAQADVDATVQYFTDKGLNVVEVTPNRLLIVIEGKTSQFEQAFAVRLNKYSMQNIAGMTNGIYLSNDSDPKVPTAIGSMIDSVAGLNDIGQLHSHAVKSPHAGNGGPHGYSPQEIAAVYGIPSVTNESMKASYSGAGKTIAIATAYGYLNSDVNVFWKQFGIKRTGSLTNVPIAGSTSQIDSETTLDLETTGALSPGADIIVYEGANARFGTFSEVYSRIVTDNKADVMTISWGSCEELTGAAQIRTDAMLLREAAAQGIATFVASGDDGAYDCPVKVPYWSVDYPSSDVNVTAVGGTSLIAVNGQRLFETAWSGSGGGISKVFGRPYYQYGKGVGDVLRRHSADVSMNADPETGYAIFFDSKWEQFGGTSISSPDWASIWSIAEQASNQRLGPANPSLYDFSRTVKSDQLLLDITTGDNGAGRGTGYPAGSGYDHPTGLGVPYVTPLVEALSGHPIVLRVDQPAVLQKEPAKSNKAGETKDQISPVETIGPGVIAPDPDGKASPR